jgi:hypothetical protein
MRGAMAGTRRRGRSLCVASLALLVCLVAGRTRAQDDYSIDLSQGAVLSSSRVTGLSGAVTAIAEGMEGGLSNPAAAAVRTAASADWWDYWVALSLTYPLDNGDFYNSGNSLDDEGGSAKADSFYFLNTGGYLQLYGLGFGLNVEILQVDVHVPDMDEAVLHLQLITNHVQVGYLFLDGQLALAGGLQVLRERATAQLGRERTSQPIDVGLGGEAGVLIRPNGAQWRAGAGMYSVVKTEYDENDRGGQIAQQFVLPQYSVRPWRGNVAFAYQFGKRPLNPRFSYVEERAREPLRALDARRRRAEQEHARRLQELRRDARPDRHARLAQEEQAFAEQELVFGAERDAIRKAAWRELRAGVRRLWARRYYLLVGEASFAGRVEDAVGLESFFAQREQRSGERITVTPRLGFESEVWPTHIKVRAGGYYEPSRFQETSARFHGTFGVDVRLFNWDVFRIWPEDYLWQLTSAIDVTRAYQAFSLGFGGWY